MDAQSLTLLRVAETTAGCPVCIDGLTAPVCLPCGHILCNSCAGQCLAVRPSCPLCNQAVRNARSCTPLPSLTLFLQTVRALMTEAAASRGTPPAAAPAHASAPVPYPATTTSMTAGRAVVPVAPHPSPGPLLQSAPAPPAIAITDEQSTQGLGTPPPHSRSGPSIVDVAARQAQGVTTPRLQRSHHPQVPDGLMGLHPLPSAWRHTRGQARLQFAPPSCVAALSPSLDLAAPCILCGLCLDDRPGMRRYLAALRGRPQAACDPVELTEHTAASLAALLGPVWGVQCEPLAANQPRQSTSHLPSRKRGRLPSTPPRVGRRGVTVPAHHNCLAWAGVLPSQVDACTMAYYSPDRPGADSAITSFTITLQPWTSLDPHATQAASVRQLLAVLLLNTNSQSPPPSVGEWRAQGCAVCGRLDQSGLPIGLRQCEAAGRGRNSCIRVFHFLCALLAGPTACVVWGLEDCPDSAPSVEVWCGPCESQRRQSC